jgi:hypothetical protein
VHKVWKHKQDGWSYVKVAGKQVKLSPVRAGAVKAMHALLANHETTNELPSGNFLPTFRKIADLYLDNSQKSNKPTTDRMHKLYLQSFIDRIKGRRVDELKVHHVTEWIAATGWGQSTSCSARGTMPACLNWAAEQGYVAGHSLGKQSGARTGGGNESLPPMNFVGSAKPCDRTSQTSSSHY